ncbi:T9SS type A sorting domain-containing protein, partial [candidate division WOR-3 bacterium]|nr:T9SS type A sorting domain-containing protein [candidate division WOR-3 bacterium]MBD3363895.1 T9SS type A sorting domain-containing protein [candidate division WOR-3 bacterium]
NDGDLEVIFADDHANVYVLDHTGSLYTAWGTNPVNVGTVTSSSPALCNIDGVGALDVIVCGHDGTDGFITALSGDDGSQIWSYTGSPPIGPVNSSPAVGDIDGDGLAEIVVGVTYLDSYNAANTGSILVLDGSSTGIEERDVVESRQVVLETNTGSIGGSTEIRYALPQGTHVELSLYSTDGRRIATLINEHQTAGSHTITWDGTDDAGLNVAAGVYFCRLSAEGLQIAEKVIRLK